MGCGQDRARHAVDTGDTPAPAPTAIPRRTPGRQQAVLDGQLVVLHPPTGRFVVVAGLAALVCVASDGRTTIAELTERIAGDLGLAATDLVDEVRATVAALCHEHVLAMDATQVDEGGLATSNPTDPPRTPITAPGDRDGLAPVDPTNPTDTLVPTAATPDTSVGLRLHGTFAQREGHTVWLCAGTDPVSEDLLAELSTEGWTCRTGELDDSAPTVGITSTTDAARETDNTTGDADDEPEAIVLVERSSAPAGEPILGPAFGHLDALVAVLPSVTDASWHDPQALQDLADRCVTTPVLPLRHATPGERAHALQALLEPGRRSTGRG